MSPNNDALDPAAAIIIQQLVSANGNSTVALSVFQLYEPVANRDVARHSLPRHALNWPILHLPCSSIYHFQLLGERQQRALTPSPASSRDAIACLGFSESKSSQRESAGVTQEALTLLSCTPAEGIAELALPSSLGAWYLLTCSGSLFT